MMLETDSSLQIENLLKHEKIDLLSGDIEQKLKDFFSKLSIDMKQKYDEKEEAIQRISVKIQEAEQDFKLNLDIKSKKLQDVSKLVNDTILKYRLASENAIRIGNRLSSIESERSRLVKAIRLLQAINSLEKIEPVEFQESLNSMEDFSTLRQSLPRSLRISDLNEFSQTLLNLRKILIDINSPTVQHAQRNIVTLSQVTESALLDQFEAIFTVLLKSKDDENLELYAEVRELAICLQSFNKGSSLEKRYLFSVVQRALTKNAARLSPSNEGFQLYSTGSVDIGAHRLSDLFRFLTAICDEQFQLIAKVFTQDVGIQMMKLLVQRVFNDPAFGIQVYMDSTLHPRTPHAVLSVEDYLRTLANIKRKLDSFYQGLVDACTYFSVIVNQVKHDSLHMRDIVDKQLSIGNGIASSPTDSVVSPRNDLGGSEMSPKNEVNKEGSNPSDNLRTFLQEQLNQVFGSYLSDYFQKEQVNLKFQYSNCLSKALHDANLFDKKTDSNTTVLSALPIFKAEKMKSIQNLAKSVGNHDFLNNVHSKVVEAVQRMSLIAKSDKKLSIRIKDTYLMHLKFMIECLLIPMMTAAETMLLKHASTSASASALPPPEFLSLLGATLTSIDKAKEHFATTFIPHFIEVPNLLLVCHEAGKAAVRELEIHCREALYAWSFCVALHIDKTLQTVQSKHDFYPQYEGITVGRVNKNKIIDPTGACISVCKSLSLVISSVQHHEKEILRLNITKDFWKPLGRQVVGVLISHIRRAKISGYGGRRLLRDLDDYFMTLVSMNVVDTLDMIHCIQEVVGVYLQPPDMVTKFVVDNLRHLDANIVMALVRARAEFGTPAAAVWTRELSTVYGPSAGWASFPWETKRVLTVLTFKSLISSAADPALLGPVTLRKSVGPLPPNVIQELSRLAQRQNLFNSNNKIRQSPAEGPLYVKSGQIIAETSTQSSGIDSTGDLVRATSPINGPRSTAFSPLPPVDASLSPRSQQSGNGEVPGSSQQSHYNRMNTPRDHSPQPSEHSDSMDGQMMTIDPKRRARNSTGSTSDVDNRVPGPASRSRKLFNFFKGK